ncbi:hypothetical protein NM208_g4178 [Fusarium decemcellulare]|uniref:Uncharacterized protein n=1 Tax=Fusarium decemcellulare TaxID=57161 RepID=A0ACC1SLY2_9HYPO|nr:hypothetical protein NM208_g4178 [Fusarium decemcellulare]
MELVQEIATIDNALRMAYVDQKPTSEHQGVMVPSQAQQFPDLSEALVVGREEVYLGHFLDKTYNASAISQKDLDYYTESYARPEAMRCSFDVYRAFPTDATENAEWIAKHGKCKVRALGLNGEKSRRGAQVIRTMEQAHQEGTFQVAEVSESGHYLAEENPEGFAAAVLDFIKAEQ